MFRKMLSGLMVLVMFFTLTACGSDLKVYKDPVGKELLSPRTYDTVGLFTIDDKDPAIRYKVIIGNVVWGVLLFETIIAPIYFFGFSMWEPVEYKGI